MTRGALGARLNQGGQDSAVKEIFTPVTAASKPPACRASHTITMRSLSPALASLANVFRIPMSLTPARPSVSRVCHETLARRPSPQQVGSVTAAVQSAPFSSTSALAKRKGKGPIVDKRISTFHPWKAAQTAIFTAPTPFHYPRPTRPHP